MYARTVWVEILDNWIDIRRKTVRCPKTKQTKAFMMKKNPQDDWLMFLLIKRKMTSGRF